MFSVSDRVHHAFCADVSSSSSINELMQNIQAAFKNVPTIAVNSAGITRDAMMLKMTEENFDKVLSVNLKVLILSDYVLYLVLTVIKKFF